MSASARPQALVERANQSNLECRMHALHGIFWALTMLVTHNAADGIAHDEDRLNGIDQLIMAGEQLTGDILDRI